MAKKDDWQTKERKIGSRWKKEPNRKNGEEESWEIRRTRKIKLEI